MSTASPPLSQPSAEMRERFQRLAADWKQQSRYLSNTAQMAILTPYQRIIGMGWPAVPLILEELRRKPDQWFWALEAITEENPVPPDAAGFVRRTADAWMNWGLERELIEMNAATPIPEWHAQELAKRIARTESEPGTSIPLDHLRAELLKDRV